MGIQWIDAQTGKPLTFGPQEEKMSQSDLVNHPPHYKRGGLECIDVIEAVGWGFHLANCVKYLWRAGEKDPEKTLEDLKKARFYLDRYIQKLEKDAKLAGEAGRGFTLCPTCAQPVYVDRPHTCYEPHPPSLRATPGDTGSGERGKSYGTDM